MKARRSDRGMALLEMLVVGIGIAFISSGLIMVIQTTATWQTVLTDQSASNAGARKTLDMFAEHVRGAQWVKVGTLSEAIIAGTATSVTYYLDASANTATYWLDATTTPATLKVTKTINLNATTTVLATGVQSLTLTYYKSPNGYAVPANQWSTTTNPNLPSPAELPQLGAIGINATFAIHSTNRAMQSFVRLRNSPG